MLAFISSSWSPKKEANFTFISSFFIVLFMQGRAPGDRMNYYPSLSILSPPHINISLISSYKCTLPYLRPWCFFGSCSFVSCLSLIYSLSVSSPPRPRPRPLRSEVADCRFLDESFAMTTIMGAFSFRIEIWMFKLARTVIFSLCVQWYMWCINRQERIMVKELVYFHHFNLFLLHFCQIAKAVIDILFTIAR